VGAGAGLIHFLRECRTCTGCRHTDPDTANDLPAGTRRCIRSRPLATPLPNDGENR